MMYVTDGTHANTLQNKNCYVVTLKNMILNKGA